MYVNECDTASTAAEYGIAYETPLRIERGGILADELAVRELGKTELRGIPRSIR